MIAIVLAAGESRRMGRPKQLLPFGEGTVLQRVVTNLLAAEVGPTLVVLGHRAEEIAASLGGEVRVRRGPHHPSLVTCVYNPDYRRGMLSSVQAGVRAAFPLLPGEGRSGFLFCLGDQPQVGPEIYRHVAGAFEGSEAAIVLPVAAGRRGHPAAFAADYAQEILSLGPESSLRDILQRHPDDVAEVAVDDSAVTEDLDTPEDYERLVCRQ